jgi:hypothetical protein
MRSSRFGGFLLGVGAAVGIAAVVGLATGFEPSRLPPALLDIAAYKLTIVAAIGLLVAGAVIRKRALRDESRADSPESPRPLADARTSAALRAAPVDTDLAERVESRSKVEVPRQP